MALRSKLTAKVDEAEAAALKAKADQKVTVHAERQVTAYKIDLINKKTQARLATIQKEVTTTKESSKLRAQSLIKDNKESRHSSDAEIQQLKNTLSNVQVKVKSVERDTKKKLNQVIADKIQTIHRMKRSTTIDTDNLKANEKRLKTSEQKCVQAVDTVQSLTLKLVHVQTSMQKELDHVQTSMQTELDAALLSVGALTADKIKLANENNALSRECAEAIEEITVRPTFVIMY